MRKSESEHTGIKKATKAGQDILTRSVTFEPNDANSLQLIPLGGGGGESADDTEHLGSQNKKSSSNKLAYVFKNVYHSMRNILSKSQSFTTTAGRKTPNTHVISGKHNEILPILCYNVLKH